MRKKYDFFWNWFLCNRHLFADEREIDSFTSELDNKILKLGNFAWEIGPGINKENSLTISPGGDEGLLTLSKDIIKEAPELTDWEFYYARQIKDWKGYFDIVLDNVERRIDISLWEYVLVKFDDNTYDILIKPNPLHEIPENEIKGIAEMIIDSIIGEERRIKTIMNVEIVNSFNDEFIRGKTLLSNLKAHLDMLLQE